MAVDGSAELLKQLSYLLENGAEAVRRIRDFQSHERDALDMIATQLEGIADRMRVIAHRLRNLPI